MFSRPSPGLRWLAVVALFFAHPWNSSGAEAPAPVFLRVALLAPEGRPWRVNVIAHTAAKPRQWFAGKTVGDAAKAIDPAAAGEATAWLDLTGAVPAQGATVRLLFSTEPPLAAEGVRARIDVASAPEEGAILRSITEHDPGNVIAIRVPGHPENDRAHLVSIREDTQRRLDEIKALNLPDGPRPRRLWCMTSFRSNGDFYTDPAIAAMDFEIVRRLGMNGYAQQNGSQPGPLRDLAHAAGLDRSTVFWRSVATLVPDPALGGASRLDWPTIEARLDQRYRQDIGQARQTHPHGMPEVIADLMDEPDGQHFDGPEYTQAFRAYAQEQGLTPADLGAQSWDEIAPILLRWRSFFTRRAELDLKEVTPRRLFYWSAKFWNYETARTYALATRKVEQYHPGTGTRVNLGPPWWYDYGTLPRGTDAFEFGRQRGVTLGFNEDWVGAGTARTPLELDALLIDWSRAAFRPAQPLLGSYITRDCDRATVKLRTFACLAREAKIFDFYFYGPSYTFFDPWSDNTPMVRGVAELTRDLGAADDVLWAGRAPKARAALLYSQSWPVWKEDDTEQCELNMAYVALLHAGIPVDIVSDAEIVDGRFASAGYKCLYVVNESVGAATARAIEHWVREGGCLSASGWAGARDEYNTPTPAWNELLGLQSRAWKPTGDLKRLGEVIGAADWMRPIFAREVTLTPSHTAPTEPLEIPGHATPAYRRSHGRGRVQVIPWTAGKDYMEGATRTQRALAMATLFPDDARRHLYSDFAQEAGIEPPATTSVNQILAWPLWTQHEGALLLANYTGEPAAEVRVRLSSPLPITKAHSLHHRDLPLTHPDADHLEFTVPMDDVTEIVQFE